MKIGLIVPIIHDHFINGLLDCVENNSVTPQKIIIIDNSPHGIILKNKSKLNLLQYKPPFSFGVNASWNYGIAEMVKDVDLISIFNDDLLVEKWFFEKLARLAKKHKGAGVFCPATVKTPEMIGNAPRLGSEKCVRMYRREGWAWTIRSTVVKEIPSIPEELKTWCGDDWYWYHCHKINQPWTMMQNTWCYHYIGRSNKIANVRKDLNKEKEIANTLLYGAASPLYKVGGA